MRPALIWLAGLWSIEAQSCVDDATWFSSRGNCASYAAGQPNNAYCSTDGATARCPRACQTGGCAGNTQIPRGGTCSTNSYNQCASGSYCKLGICVEGTVTGDYYNNNNVASTSGVAAYTGGISVYSAAQPPIAGQKDIHGCRNGMGEFWCESQNACLYYTIPCIGIPRGNDASRCGDGYSWCPVKNRCINPGFEPCSPISSGSIGAPSDQYGCQISQGYFYCSLLGRCIQPSRESCVGPSSRYGDVLSVGGADSNGCYIGGGYSWCASKSKCLRVWEEPCDDSSQQRTPDLASTSCSSAGEEYKSCSSMCEPVCGQAPAACVQSCGPPMCQCRDGWSRSNGVCVLTANCPSTQASTLGYDPNAPITFGPALNGGTGLNGGFNVGSNGGFNVGSNGGFNVGSNGGFGGFNGFTSGYFTRQPVSWQSSTQNYGLTSFGR